MAYMSFCNQYTQNTEKQMKLDDLNSCVDEISAEESVRHSAYLIDYKDRI